MHPLVVRCAPVVLHWQRRAVDCPCPDKQLNLCDSPCLETHGQHASSRACAEARADAESVKVLHKSCMAEGNASCHVRVHSKESVIHHGSTPTPPSSTVTPPSSTNTDSAATSPCPVTMPENPFYDSRPSAPIMAKDPSPTSQNALQVRAVQVAFTPPREENQLARSSAGSSHIHLTSHDSRASQDFVPVVCLPLRLHQAASGLPCVGRH